MRRILGPLLLVGVACGEAAAPSAGPGAPIAEASPSATPAKPASAAPTASAAPAPPWVWWDVKPGPGIDAVQIAFLPTEITFLDKNGAAHPRPAKLTQSAEHAWVYEMAPGSPATTCTLDVGTGAQLRCVDARGRTDKLTLEKITDERRRADLDALLAKNRPSADACAKAEPCCKDAFKALGATCDPDEELGKPRFADKCEQFLRVIRETLAEAKKQLPASCK
jgi:hypothetical protein